MTEAELRALGIQRIPVPVPFPQAGGPVNVYLVDEADGGLLMFDAGLGSPEGEAALEAGFDAAGRRFGEVTRIVLSHGHVDHYGAARTVMERAGRAIPVYAHPAEIAKVAESGRRWRDQFPAYAAYLARLGVPAEAIAHIGGSVGSGHALARRIADVTPIAPGAVISTRCLALEVHHMPGHTPGLVCLHDRARRLVFAGDHLLEKVSPNPLIDLGPDGREGWFRPLVAYLDSLARLRAMDVDVVLPGHGAPFGDPRAVIDGLVAFYEARQGRIRAALAAGPLTGYELARTLFPASRALDLFLVMSEIVANLEVLEDRGEVRRGLLDERYQFALSP